MSGDVEISIGGAGDLDAVGAFYLSILKTMEGVTPPEDEAGYLTDFSRSGPGGDGHFDLLVARVDGEIAGIALYDFGFDPRGPVRVAKLRDIAVDPARRRQGIGTALMKSLAGITVEQGCARLDWHVDRLDLDTRVFFDTMIEDCFRLHRLSYSADLPDLEDVAGKG